MKTNTKLIALASVLFSIASLLAVISDVDAFNWVSSPTLAQSWRDSKFYFVPWDSTTITYSWVIVYTSPSLYTIESMVQTSIVYSNTNIERVHAIFTWWYYHNLIPLNFIFNKNNWNVLHVQSSDFVVNNTLIRYNPTNAVWPVLEVYTIDIDTMTITATPQYLWEAPDIDDSQTTSWDSIYNFFTGTPPVNTSFVAPAQIPLIIKYKDNTYAFVYLGTDGYTYTLQMSWTTPKLIREPAQAVSIWPTFSFNWNTSFFVRKYPDWGTNSSGSFLVQNDYDRHFETSTPFHPWIDITNITTFENPILYFRTTDSSIYSWDLNCTDPLYSTCRFDFTEQANYCAWEPWVFDPRHIRCDIQVSTTISQNTSTGSTSSGSSYLTDVGYTPTPQTCTWVTFSGTTTLTNTTEDLQPLTCTWRTLSGSYQCQDINAHICTSNGDACLQQIDNPSQYAGSGTVTTTEVTRLNCTSATKSCTWVDKNTCGNSTDCYVDWNACKVKPTLTLPNVPTVAESNYVNPLKATGSIVKTQGTTPGIVYSTWSTTTCELFDDNGNFIYTNTSLYTFQYDFTAVTDIQALKIPLWYLNRVQEFVTRPVNTLLGLGSSFIPPDNGSKVCLMGISYPVEYQSFLKLANGTGTTIWPFKDAPTLNFDGTKRTVIDYFVIIFFLVSAGSIAWMLFYFVKHS